MSPPTYVADYSQSIPIATSPEKAFKALTIDIGSWWGSVNRSPQRVGDVFTVSWGPAFYSFEILAFRPYKSVTWKCIDANQIIPGLQGVQREWVGNQLEWNITELEGHFIELNFLHRGLNSNCLCYEFCSAAWDKYICFELREHLEKDLN